jgi:cytidyltransferase-like protein
MPKKYSSAAVGGTFDRFHKGHEHLLSLGAETADQLVVGVSTAPLIKNKILTQIIDPYDLRVNEISKYLNTLGVSNHQILPLNDPFGPTLSDTDLEALVVSPQTLPGAQLINQKRQTNGLSPLAIEVSLMIADDTGVHLSSSRIRQGKVNRLGKVYQSIFSSDLKLSDRQKIQIREPQGELIKPESLTPGFLNPFTSIVLIGDQVTEQFIARHLPFHYAIIDNYINRQPHSTDLGIFKPANRLTVQNPPGIITQSASKVIFDLPSLTTLIKVEGEEDLLGFPFALSLPLQSAVFYGQPGQGIVMIVLTESKKDMLAQILKPDF